MRSKHRKSRFTGFRAIAALLGAGAVMLAAGATVLGTSGTASAKPDANKKVVVCKYVGTPGGQLDHIIIVSASTLGKDWPGTFPASFPDAQDSLAIRYASAGEQAKDVPLSECPGGEQPKDVCPNIDGVQEVVPEGYVLEDGKCVKEETPPVDVCPNIEGDQAEVPAGYVLEDGKCVKEEESESPSPSEEVSPSEAIEGTETVAPTHAPTVLGTEATAFPTAVHAGLAGQPPTSPGASLLGLSLVGGGLILMTGAGWLAAARRARGEHQV